MHFFDRGVGRAIVLLHGLPSPAADLEGLAEDLSGHRVIVPHLPGYGRSAAAPGAQGVDAVDDTLADGLSRLGVERPVIVGYSMGGYRALKLALRCDPAAVVVLAGFAALSQDERTGFLGFAEALRAGTDLRGVAPSRFLSPAFRERHPEGDAAVRAWLDLAPSLVLAEELEDAARAPSLLDRLSELRCPVIARTGELDVAVPPSHARDINAACLSSTLEIVPGVGHALLLEDRAGTIETLRRVCAIA